MEAVVVLVLVLLISLLAYWIVFRDLLAPVILIHLSFIGALLLLIKGAERLEYTTYSYETSLVIFSGITMFSIGGMLCYINVDKRPKYSGVNNPKPVWLPEYVLLLLAIFTSVVAYIQFRHELAYVGAGAFTEIVSEYRDESTMEGDVPQNQFVSLASRIIYAIQPLLILLMFYNRITCRKKFKHPVLIGVSFLIYVVAMFVMAGSRGKIFTIIFQILFALAISYNFSKYRITIRLNEKVKTYLSAKGIRKEVMPSAISVGIINKYRKNLPGNKIWIRMVIIAILIGIPIFYYVGVIQGKRYSDMNTFEPVENYFSYGLIRLDNDIRNGFPESDHFGQWTFAGAYSFFNKLGANYPNYDSIPFFDRYGNTITIFGRWYYDFNLFGVFLISFVVGYFFSYIYYKMVYASNNKKALKFSIWYVFFMNIVLMASYDDWVKGQITLNGIFQIMFLGMVIRTLLWYNFERNRTYKLLYKIKGISTHCADPSKK